MAVHHSTTRSDWQRCATFRGSSHDCSRTQRHGGHLILCFGASREMLPPDRKSSAGRAQRAQTSARELWLFAERRGRIVGGTHAALLPVPPVYDCSAGAPPPLPRCLLLSSPAA